MLEAEGIEETEGQEDKMGLEEGTPQGPSHGHSSHGVCSSGASTSRCWPHGPSSPRMRLGVHDEYVRDGRVIDLRLETEKSD